MENQYFEDNSPKASSEDEIIKRIKECEMVVDKLDNSDVWKVVINDAVQWSSQLDNMWQDVMDEDKLKQMRVLKLAYKHIMDLPTKYREQLAALQEGLKRENEIEKDYDG